MSKRKPFGARNTRKGGEVEAEGKQRDLAVRDSVTHFRQGEKV